MAVVDCSCTRREERSIAASSGKIPPPLYLDEGWDGDEDKDDDEDEDEDGDEDRIRR